MADWGKIFDEARALDSVWTGVKPIVMLNPPAKRLKITNVRSQLQREIPPEVVELLSYADGGIILPAEGMDLGVGLLSAWELIEADRSCAVYDVEHPDPNRPFVFGRITGAGELLGVFRDSVWWIHPGWGYLGWRQENGCKRVTGTIEEFFKTLVQKRGSLWWLDGFPK